MQQDGEKASREAVPTVSSRIAEMDKHARRRAIRGGVRHIVVAWLLLITIYYTLPVNDVTTAANIVRFGAATAVFVIALGWETRRILKADMPMLRAIEALGVAVPLFLVLFSMLYLGMDNASAG